MAAIVNGLSSRKGLPLKGGEKQKDGLQKGGARLALEICGPTPRMTMT